MKICGIYKITNTITNDFYIGSSKNVKSRWAHHKIPSTWKRYSNNPMYLDFQKYGVDEFEFEVLEVLEEAEPDRLKEKEQQFIEKLQPTYNQMNANGCDIERYNEAHRKARRKYNNQLCSYNGHTLTLATLSWRFKSQGIDHPTLEAKKYLIKR